jgi:hypothetical protein
MLQGLCVSQCVCVCCRYVDIMNNRQTPDSSAGAFLTAVLEVQNKQWSTAKGAQCVLLPAAENVLPALMEVANYQAEHAERNSFQTFSIFKTSCLFLIPQPPASIASTCLQ